VLTTLALPGQTLAAAWSEPRAVSGTSSADLDQLVALDSKTLVVEFGVFNDSRGPFYLTRSSNGGRSWSAATRVPYSHLSGGSGLLDRVWIERGRVLYARSSDAGKTFGSARTLTPANEYAGDADVARGPDHRVAVVWRVRDGDTYSRLSVDDGATFGGAAVVAANNRLRLSDLAVSNSGIVATYFIGFRLIVKSSDASGRALGQSGGTQPLRRFRIIHRDRW